MAAIDERVFYLTAEGKARYEEELRHLIEVRRPQVANQIKEAKEAGDITDNAAFEDAKLEQSNLEMRIRELEYMLKHSVPIDEGKHSAAEGVQMGARVTVRDQRGNQRQFMIVGSAEANPTEGRISNVSPLGSVLMGKFVGDEVVVKAPSGEFRYHITAID